MWWNPLCGSLTDTDQEVLTCFSTEMARYTVRKHIHYMWLCFLFFFPFTGGWGWPTLTHSHTCSSSQPFSTPTMQKKGLALLFAFCQIVINSNVVTLGQREHSLVIPCIHTLFTCLSHLCSLCFSLPSHVDPVQHRPPCASALVHPLSFFVDKIPKLPCVSVSALWARLLAHASLHTKYILKQKCNAVDGYII